MTGVDKLGVTARKAAACAYAPFSRFRVGAAVLADGTLHTGANVENASYGMAMCAERVAIFSAVAAGARRIEALALACIDAGPGDGPAALMPCGACLQVMAEFAGPDLPITVEGAGIFRLGDLLPQAFTLGRAGR